MASAPDGGLGAPAFATLGPAGSNHDFVARAFLAAHALGDQGLQLFPDFGAAFAALDAGAAEFVLQVAVHPTVAETVGRNLGKVHLVDAFIAPSQAMAVLTRKECGHPRRIAFMPATRAYVDLTGWAEHCETPSTVDAWRMLEAGEVDSALTLARFADCRPNDIIVETQVDPPTDAWLVYGRTPLPSPGWSLWRESPAAALYRAAATAT